MTWQALDHAPAWLALDDAALRMLRRRVGSVLLAPALRLWISAAKVQAARAALGDAWWTRLVSHQAWPTWSADAGDWPVAAIPKTPEAVAEILEEAGGAVLVATLPHGALRHAASVALAPVADVALLPSQAQAVFSIARPWLEAEAVSMVAARTVAAARDDSSASPDDDNKSHVDHDGQAAYLATEFRNQAARATREAIGGGA